MIQMHAMHILENKWDHCIVLVRADWIVCILIVHWHTSSTILTKHKSNQMFRKVCCKSRYTTFLGTKPCLRKDGKRRPWVLPPCLFGQCPKVYVFSGHLPEFLFNSGLDSEACFFYSLFFIFP